MLWGGGGRVGAARERPITKQRNKTSTNAQKSNPVLKCEELGTKIINLFAFIWFSCQL